MLLHFIHWCPTVLLLPSPTGPGCLFSHLCLPNTSHSQDQDSIVFLSWILLRQPHWERISVSGQLQLQPDVYVASKFNLHSVISSCMWASTFHSGRQNWSGKHLHLSWRQPKMSRSFTTSYDPVTLMVKTASVTLISFQRLHPATVFKRGKKRQIATTVPLHILCFKLCHIHFGA